MDFRGHCFTDSTPSLSHWGERGDVGAYAGGDCSIVSHNVFMHTGYLATIVIPMLFGFEDVPFRFSACSEDCKEIVDHRFEAIQSQRTYLNPAKESYAHLEPYHIWTLRRLSKLGCYTDMSLRVNPNQLAKDLDLNLVDDDAILTKITANIS